MVLVFEISPGLKDADLYEKAVSLCNGVMYSRFKSYSDFYSIFIQYFGNAFEITDKDEINYRGIKIGKLFDARHVCVDFKEIFDQKMSKDLETIASKILNTYGYHHLESEIIEIIKKDIPEIILTLDNMIMSWINGRSYLISEIKKVSDKVIKFEVPNGGYCMFKSRKHLIYEIEQFARKEIEGAKIDVRVDNIYIENEKLYIITTPPCFYSGEIGSIIEF